MSIFDKEKFLSYLVKEKDYNTENIKGYIDALISEAKKYI